MTEIPANLQPFLVYLERVSRGRGARLILSRTFPSAIGESVDYTWCKGLDHGEGKAVPPRRGHGGLWKSASTESTGALGELNTNSDCV